MHQTHTQFLHWILWKIFERPGWEGMAWYGTVWHGTTWSVVSTVSETALILCRFHATSSPVNVANDYLINRHWVWGFLSSTATAAAKCVATCDRQLQRLPQQQLARSSWGWVEVDWFKNASHVYIYLSQSVNSSGRDVWKVTNWCTTRWDWQVDSLTSSGNGKKEQKLQILNLGLEFTWESKKKQ